MSTRTENDHDNRQVNPNRSGRIRLAIGLIVAGVLLVTVTSVWLAQQPIATPNTAAVSPTQVVTNVPAPDQRAIASAVKADASRPAPAQESNTRDTPQQACYGPGSTLPGDVQSYGRSFLSNHKFEPVGPSAVQYNVEHSNLVITFDMNYCVFIAQEVSSAPDNHPSASASTATAKVTYLGESETDPGVAAALKQSGQYGKYVSRMAPSIPRSGATVTGDPLIVYYRTAA